MLNSGNYGELSKRTDATVMSNHVHCWSIVNSVSHSISVCVHNDRITIAY